MSGLSWASCGGFVPVSAVQGNTGEAATSTALAALPAAGLLGDGAKGAQMLTRYGTEAETTTERLAAEPVKAEAHPTTPFMVFL